LKYDEDAIRDIRGLPHGQDFWGEPVRNGDAERNQRRNAEIYEGYIIGPADMLPEILERLKITWAYMCKAEGEPGLLEYEVSLSEAQMDSLDPYWGPCIWGFKVKSS
jgi:hypothetical protein